MTARESGINYYMRKGFSREEAASKYHNRPRGVCKYCGLPAISPKGARCEDCKKALQRECMNGYRKRVRLIGSDIKDIIWPSPWAQDAAMQAEVLSRYICPLAGAVAKAPPDRVMAAGRSVRFKEGKHDRP